jgi:hypothetical protein
MPTDGASCGSDPGSRELFCGGGSSVLSPCHASLSAQGSNASGFAVVAPSAPPASLMLAVPSVGAGAPFTSNDEPSGLCASMTARLTAFAPVFPAVWTGPRPTPPALSGGLHTNRQLQGFKTRFDGMLYGGGAFARCNATYAGVEQWRNRKRVSIYVAVNCI